MAQKRGGRLVKFVLFLFLLVLILVVLVFAFNFSKGLGVGAGVGGNASVNHTVVQNITNVHITNVEAGENNFWDASVWLGTFAFALAFLAFLAWLFYSYLMRRRPFTSKNKEACIKRALAELRRMGYEVDFESPKQSYRFFGVDEERNPGWVFVFVRSGVSPALPVESVPLHGLVSCCVDAKTLEVFNEGHGRDLECLKKELHDQRFGRLGVPNWAGKTEKEPTLADLFQSNSPSLNVAIDPGEYSSEGGGGS